MLTLTVIDAPDSTVGTDLLGINNDGEIIGGSNYAFSYMAGTFTTLDVPAGLGIGGGPNDAGQYVGQFTDGTGTHGFVYDNGTYTTIDDPDATIYSNGKGATEANGINNLGQVVGIFQVGSVFDGFLENNGTFTTIADPLASGSTVALGINDSGEVVGFYFDSTGGRDGFLYNDGTYSTVNDPLAPGGAGGTGTGISGINNAGEMIGWYYDSSNVRHAFVDDGGTFTTIDYPQATVTFVNGINNSGEMVGSYVDSSNISHGLLIACFARGTRIATPVGDVAVENLMIGDVITTRACAAKCVKWVGRRSYAQQDIAANPGLQPVLIKRNALSHGIPSRDLMVSPMHSLLIDEVLVPAVALVNGVSIVRCDLSGAVEYFHIELDEHELIFAEGAVAETFIDDNSRTMFDNASEYYDLYGSAELPKQFCLPRIEQGHQLEVIRQCLAARAGATTAATIDGDLVGHVERMEGGLLEGWVLDHSNPAVPVDLEVLVDGEVVATALANRYRVDLDRPHLAGGRCGFTVALLPATRLEQIRVCRSNDGRPVPIARLFV